MATPLGAGAGNGWKVLGLNDSSTAIARGECVALKPGSTTTYLSDSIQEEILPVQKFSSSNDYALGVAAMAIPAGKVGDIVVVGYVKVLSGAAIASAAALEPLDASAKFDDASGGLAGNAEVGIALEAASGADVLTRAFVNFLGWDGGMGGA